MTQIVVFLAIFCSLLVGCATDRPAAVHAKRSQAQSEKLTVMISTARKEDIIPIPTREVPAARKRAANGDIKAINKLIGYYLKHDEDAEAQKWSHRRDEILAKRSGQ